MMAVLAAAAASLVLALTPAAHTFAIERANVARRRARHRPVRTLAKAIVRAQNREIVQFRDWAVARYAR